MQWRQATERDLAALARMNQQLIQDEGSRNRMTLGALELRLRGWLQSTYVAVLFSLPGTPPVAYAIYRDEPGGIYLRQFFVDRHYRRQGVGRQAMHLLLHEIWAPEERIVLDVLAHNERGRAFWQSLGFQEYAITMEWFRPQRDN